MPACSSHNYRTALYHNALAHCPLILQHDRTWLTFHFPFPSPHPKQRTPLTSSKYALLTSPNTYYGVQQQTTRHLRLYQLTAAAVELAQTQNVCRFE